MQTRTTPNDPADAAPGNELHASDGERRLQHLVDRLHAEYSEMPGLSLTSAQVQRLCGIERTACQIALDTLVSEKFLCVKRNGTYARQAEGHHPRPAKAALPRRFRLGKAS